MNKIISTFSILAIVIIANACRQQDDDLTLNNATKEQNTNFILKKNDSIKTPDSINSINQQAPEGDPPPKNGHQWLY